MHTAGGGLALQQVMRGRDHYHTLTLSVDVFHAVYTTTYQGKG